MDGDKEKKHKKKGKVKELKDKEIEAELEAAEKSGSGSGDAAPPEDVQVDAEGAEVLSGESKSILLHLISQLRIGMDLSRVTLPTFILEPKSFLEKLTDFMTHPDVALRAADCDSAVERMVAITRWYLSGFYIRPKGVKKPYNPILGEIFRANWDHGSSQTFYVSEQVSHHPPVSAFYGSNRKKGLAIQGSVHFRSKFMGNSTAAILDGEATVYFLRIPEEEYVITFPTAYARGILWGTLLMELGGMVYITCKKTNLKAEIEFKTKPYFGGGYNQIAGKIKETSGKKRVLYTLSGQWDKQVTIKGHDDKKPEVLWDPADAPPKLPMNIRSLEEQDPWESRRLWADVTAGLRAGDQEAATDAKCKLEEAQRAAVKQRDEEKSEYKTKLFEKDDSGVWIYKYANFTAIPEDECDLWEEFEEDGIIQCRKKGEGEKKKHKKKKDKKDGNGAEEGEGKKEGKEHDKGDSGKKGDKKKKKKEKSKADD